MMQQPAGFVNLSKQRGQGYRPQRIPQSALSSKERASCMSLQKGNTICFGSTQVLQRWVAGWVERRKESHGFRTALSDLLFMTSGISSLLLE